MKIVPDSQNPFLQEDIPSNGDVGEMKGEEQGVLIVFSMHLIFLLLTLTQRNSVLYNYTKKKRGKKMIYYLKKAGKTIFEATITPTDDILKETEEFWK